MRQICNFPTVHFMLDILETESATPLDLSEIVYFPSDEEMTDNQVEKRLKPIRSDIEALAARIGGLVTPSATNTPAAHDNWVKRNAYWFWPTIAVVFGSGAVSTVVGIVLSFVV